ncbi:Disordered region of unknown function (DUF5315) [Teratosphaeria destructans]|uniref:Uncharacterized protein n=1 Tax=Teratosphaeria destructans TaxID=418781 RepID=A0A9W7SQN0_9PEZI|nr:Disordered region of unknown function (DUF5315) [Teratosphaeria destructans]
MSTKTSPTSPTSPTKPSSPTSSTKPNRLPAPTLFVGPPSRNTSQLSISRQTHDPTTGKPSRDPLSRQRSALSRPHPPHDPDASAIPEHDPKESPTPTPTTTIKKSSEKDIDARWREMQSTLNEVELTAQSTTHVFGESHAAALDDLRRAQGASTTTTTTTTTAPQAEVNRFQGADNLAADRREQERAHRPPTGRARGDTATSASTTLSDESSSSATSTSGGGRSAGGQLEDETAADIRLASERRAKNEAYFRKVDEGVKEVVRKLEGVAEAMRGVEGESRSLWSESSTSTREGVGS